jgi:hypothetical protein
MASLSLPIQCFSSDTGWDGDPRYPHTTRCYGFETAYEWAPLIPGNENMRDWA